jgi:hypothetical protein
MASHYSDNVLHGGDHPDNHPSANRWRHQESSSYAKHARAPDDRSGSNDLANFLNSSRVDPLPKSTGSMSRHTPIAVPGNTSEGREDVLEVKCGPLLNYRRMEDHTWFGSVLIVTKGGGLHDRPPPVLLLKAGVDANIRSLDGQLSTNGLNGVEGEGHGVVNGVDYSTRGSTTTSQAPSNGGPTNGITNGDIGDTKIIGTKLYSDPNNKFWRFDLEVPMKEKEIRCDYSIPGLSFLSETKNDKQSFYIPAITDSMRIMFHSCNGFSVGTDEDAYSGACLWNDVQRVHGKTPFHIM